mmetsp:Transcript_8428/g.25304  ORF Transcript_8428/g.25304 Transcript_8428/m.25304 type:complete len:370 (-) Transcript_8428:226-1335(-)
MRTLAAGYPPSLLVKKTLMLLVLAPSPAVRSRDTPLGPDADDGHDDHAQRHAKEPNRRRHEGVRLAQLMVRHEPLWPEHAHSSEEEEAAADGVEHANRDVRGLGLAVVVLAKVRGNADGNPDGGGQRVESGHGELLPEGELGVQHDLTHREPLEELVECDRDHQRNPLGLGLQPQVESNEHGVDQDGQLHQNRAALLACHRLGDDLFVALVVRTVALERVQGDLRGHALRGQGGVGVLDLRRARNIVPRPELQAVVDELQDGHEKHADHGKDHGPLLVNFAHACIFEGLVGLADEVDERRGDDDANPAPLEHLKRQVQQTVARGLGVGTECVRKSHPEHRGCHDNEDPSNLKVDVVGVVRSYSHHVHVL